MDIVQQKLRKLKHAIFTGEHQPVEDQIKANDNSCDVKISRRQMQAIDRLHLANSIPYADMV